MSYKGYIPIVTVNALKIQKIPPFLNYSLMINQFVFIKTLIRSDVRNFFKCQLTHMYNIPNEVSAGTVHNFLVTGNITKGRLNLLLGSGYCESLIVVDDTNLIRLRSNALL